jgi:hypothetical protein
MSDPKDVGSVEFALEEVLSVRLVALMVDIDAKLDNSRKMVHYNESRSSRRNMSTAN